MAKVLVVANAHIDEFEQGMFGIVDAGDPRVAGDWLTPVRGDAMTREQLDAVALNAGVDTRGAESKGAVIKAITDALSAAREESAGRPGADEA